jgi:hypothetical protein
MLSPVGGTEGSNPASSSAECVSALRRDRGFELGLLQRESRTKSGKRLPTGLTETRRVFRYRVNWRQYLCRSIFGLPAASRTGISLEGEAFAALLAPTAHPLVAESRIG